MLPILFRLGPLTLYTHGVVVFIAIILAGFVIFKRGRELRLPEDQLFDVLFMSLLISVLASRIGFVLTNWNLFQNQPWQAINVVGIPGFGELSGLVGLGLGLWWQSNKKKWDYFQLLDVIVVGLLLLQAFFGLADFLNGSRAGLATRWPIGVKFVNYYERRLPVQLWDMTASLVLFIWLWKMESKYRTFGWYKGQKSQASSGFMVSMYLILYGFIGFAGSNFRPQSLYFVSVPVLPLAYLAMMGLGTVVLLFRAGMSLRKMAKDWFGLTPLIPKN